MPNNIMPFMKIDNRFFFEKNETTNQSEISNKFKVIGTEGFTIYCYFLHRQGSSISAEVSIKMLTAVIGKMDGLKDIRTIKKYITVLQKNNFVKLHNFDSCEDIGLNDIMVISCSEHVNTVGFLSVPTQMFIEKVRHIGHIGWSILCLLGKLHNKKFGCDECNGFAYVSEETIAKIIDRGTTSVKKYLEILENIKLIRIERQKPKFGGVDKNGNMLWDYIPNHYIVHFVGSKDTKYYLELNSKKSKASDAEAV